MVRGSSDPTVDEGPQRWEDLPPTRTRSHDGKGMSYAYSYGMNILESSTTPLLEM